MVLRNQVEWALHCCAVMAPLEPGKYLATKTLAEFHGIPKEYLSKALQALAQAGLVEGTLGPTGGYRLAKPPKDISFLTIVEAIEGRKRSFECTEIRGNNPCLTKSEKKMSGICNVAKVMYKADEAWRKELRNFTLADLLKDLSSILTPEQMARSQEWLNSK